MPVEVLLDARLGLQVAEILPNIKWENNKETGNG